MTSAQGGMNQHTCKLEFIAQSFRGAGHFKSQLNSQLTNADGRKVCIFSRLLIPSRTQSTLRQNPSWGFRQKPLFRLLFFVEKNDKMISKSKLTEIGKAGII